MHYEHPGSDRSTITLVVPMFNEEERVAESLDKLVAFIAAQPEGSQLVLVDDGSDDRTVEVVRSGIKGHSGLATVLAVPHAGKGAAIRAGMAGARTDMAAFCDVDLATPLSEVQRLVADAASGQWLTIGSRAVGDAHLARREERRRELSGKAFNRLVQATVCPGISDTQCGAKAAPVHLWDAVLPHSREGGFAWDVEVIALARRLGFEVNEVGVKWRHDDRTRVRVLHDGAAMVWAVGRISRRVGAVTTEVALTAQTVGPAQVRVDGSEE
jgi:dolichyl-phosphate beta-glucosyltransferase